MSRILQYRHRLHYTTVTRNIPIYTYTHDNAARAALITGRSRFARYIRAVQIKRARTVVAKTRVHVHGELIPRRGGRGPGREGLKKARLQ